MALQGYQNKPVDLVYDTEGTQSGLTDLRFDIYDPNGVHDPLLDFVIATEVGNTGVYKATFTPALTGTYVVIASSALSSPAIADKGGTVTVYAHDETATAGAGFVSATDSLEAISNAIAGVAAAQGAPTARGRVIS